MQDKDALLRDFTIPVSSSYSSSSSSLNLLSLDWNAPSLSLKVSRDGEDVHRLKVVVFFFPTSATKDYWRTTEQTQKYAIFTVARDLSAARPRTPGPPCTRARFRESVLHAPYITRGAEIESLLGLRLICRHKNRNNRHVRESGIMRE